MYRGLLFAFGNQTSSQMYVWQFCDVIMFVEKADKIIPRHFFLLVIHIVWRQDLRFICFMFSKLPMQGMSPLWNIFYWSVYVLCKCILVQTDYSNIKRKLNKAETLKKPKDILVCDTLVHVFPCEENFVTYIKWWRTRNSRAQVTKPKPRKVWFHTWWIWWKEKQVSSIFIFIINEIVHQYHPVNSVGNSWKIVSVYVCM